MLTHHAYLLEGSQSDFHNLKDSIHPFVATWYERFGIDDARALVAQSALRREGESVYLLGSPTIATEAQQALLKLFEEPREGLRFIVVVPHGTLLPTLRSRMLMYPEASKLSGQNSLAGRVGPRGLFGQEVLTFLKSSQKERSDIIAKMLKDDEGVKERVRELLDGLEAELHTNIANPGVRKALDDIALVRDYVRDRSPSMKMLLEHLALALPNT